MTCLFHLGHPAHFHLFKNVIQYLKENGHIVKVVIKKKDVLEQLLTESNLEYVNVLPQGRKNTRGGIFLGMIVVDWKLFLFCKKHKPDLLVGTSVSISHVGKILGIPSINVNEDDIEAVPWYGKLAYPGSSIILAPSDCRTGKWEKKTIHYEGYHELGYLDKKYFNPDKSKIEDHIDVKTPFFLLRFSSLTAHHDRQKTGITPALAKKLIGLLKTRGNVYVTSEKELETEFEAYRLPIHPEHIHHALFFAAMVVGDSQTMTAEAAVLGTPAIRFNDFVGKLSYLEELEHQYGLTWGFKTSEPEKLISKIEELLKNPGLDAEWQKRRQRMLNDKIDVTAFMGWFIEKYPESVEIMKKNPDYQFNFK
jgi:predicted glycosyltransferase